MVMRRVEGCCGAQVLDAFGVGVARSQNATGKRGQIATVMRMVMMKVMVVVVTYGQSAWCEP